MDVNECDYLVDRELKNDRLTGRNSSTMNEYINVIIRKKQTHSDLADFLHAACFSPVISTFHHAVKNNHFITWPGLTPQLISKHLTKKIATAKGHLNQERKHLQSTKSNQPDYKKYIESIKNNIKRLRTSLPDGVSLADTLKKDIFDDAFHPPQENNIKTNDVIYALIDSKSGLGYMDLTGRFPYQSSRGNNYLMVAYNYDANAILVEALKNRQAASIVDAWTLINKKLNEAGIQPNTYILDNECSSELKKAFHKDSIGFQRVPPSCHRANMAERAILTFKSHFKAGLASLDPDYPIREWDRLLPQAEMTLNLLRSSRLNPKLSAHAFLFGQFDYNKTPIVPPGTKVVVHKKT